MKKKILLAEDDPNLGSILKEFLEVKNFSVSLSADGEDAASKFNRGSFDLCILDVMMPKKDGFTVAREIRKQNEDIPIIFLTAKSMQRDKIEGFKIGADDYITKPFSTEELFLRMNAILKRTSASSGNNLNFQNNLVQVGKFKFDYENRTLTSGEDEHKLTSKEADLLRMLSINKNALLVRSEALKNIWGESNYFTSRSMDVYIAKLRSYLKDDDSVQIVNVHGSGYKLSVNDQR